MRIALLLAILAGPALAQDAVTADEFEALVEGRTLTYGGPGVEPYGVEQYRPGRRVTWSWIGTQECQEGTWYAEGPVDAPSICFIYDNDPEPKCWRFTQEGDRLRALFLNDPGDVTYYELAEDDGSLVCGGVGV